ncbi:helix-turn-helix domain-containing protein [Thermodesulfobacteriota bacterium]
MEAIKINKLRLIMLAKGLTQKQLGEMADISAGTVNAVIRRIENGDIGDRCTKKNIKLIALALELKPAQIIGDVVIVL